MLILNVSKDFFCSFFFSKTSFWTEDEEGEGGREDIFLLKFHLNKGVVPIFVSQH